jgi:RND superfamily putative drug exporter
MFHGTAHVVLGSGMTIAAPCCAALHPLPYSRRSVSDGFGMATVVFTALTLDRRSSRWPSRFRNVLEPSAPCGSAAAAHRRGDRALAGAGAVATIALSLVGLLALPATEPTTTTATTCRTTCPPRRASPPPSGTSRWPDESRGGARRDRPGPAHSADFLVIDRSPRASSGAGVATSRPSPGRRVNRWSSAPSPPR